MALILEDGTAKVDSNTYVLEVDFNSFLSSRGYVLSGNYTVENLLILAMDYLETQVYIGSKLTQKQALLWPCFNVYIDGFPFPTDKIPKELINAQMQLAWSIDQGTNPMSNKQQDIKRERVEGAVEVEYQDGSVTQSIATAVNKTLRKLLLNSGASFRASLSV